MNRSFNSFVKQVRDGEMGIKEAVTTVLDGSPSSVKDLQNAVDKLHEVLSKISSGNNREEIQRANALLEMNHLDSWMISG